MLLLDLVFIEWVLTGAVGTTIIGPSGGSELIGGESEEIGAESVGLEEEDWVMKGALVGTNVEGEGIGTTKVLAVV